MSSYETTTLVDIGMPRLSDSMEEATVLEWLKQPGDHVARGAPLVEVETDKATMVYEAEVEGVIAELVVPAGGTAALGETIARIAVAGAAAAVPSPVEPEPAQASADPAPVASEEPVVQGGVSGSRARATPVARRLARELGVALEHVSGTGPGGRIVRADVRAQSGNGPGTALAESPRGTVTEIDLTATQRTIARRMSESRAEVPEFTVEAEIDMEHAHRLREEWRAAGHDPLPSFNDFVVKAVALALREHPALNASYAETRALRFSRVNVGIAVATDDALYVPTIFDADARSVAEITAESRRLTELVRSRSITTEDLEGGTFTVSNLGMFGVRRFNAVINRPQAAILAVGEVTVRPWVTPDGGIAPRRLMDVALSCDHRIVYGADGARFLQRLRELLERPDHLDGG